jgi:hypothetical protein
MRSLLLQLYRTLKRAPYIHTVYSSEAKMAGATSTCSAPRRRRQKTFSDPVRVNDKEGEAGNSGGLRRETAKSTHTPVLDWMQQHRRRNWRSCNRGFLLGWKIISLLVLAVGLWHLQLGTYVRTYYNPDVEKNATKTGCKSYVGGRYSKHFCDGDNN